jgi:hypothetical protein
MLISNSLGTPGHVGPLTEFGLCKTLAVFRIVCVVSPLNLIYFCYDHLFEYYTNSLHSRKKKTPLAAFFELARLFMRLLCLIKFLQHPGHSSRYSVEGTASSTDGLQIGQFWRVPQHFCEPVSCSRTSRMSSQASQRDREYMHCNLKFLSWVSKPLHHLLEQNKRVRKSEFS